MFVALANVPLYLLSLSACTTLSLPTIFRQLRPASVATNPITLCVLGILVAAVLSNLVQLDFRAASKTAYDCLPFGLYYFVLVGVVDSPRRLRALLLWIVFFIFIICCLGLLIHSGYIEVQADAAEGTRAQSYREVQEGTIDEETGDDLVLARLCGVGVYNNPNDLSRILVVGVMLCLYCFGNRGFGVLRYLWALPIGFFTYALQLTYSRGGFLALVTSILTLTMSHFGRARSLLLSAIMLPVLFAMFAGRTTSIDTSGGTGQQRIQIWRDAFAEMQASPVFGVGVGQLTETLHIMAHNSFVQCFAEMGMLGGTCFASAFYFGMWGPYRLAPCLKQIPDKELRRLRPFLIAVIAGSIVGMFSSTRCYRVDTYLLLGLSAAYLSTVAKLAPASSPRLDIWLLGRMALVGFFCVLSFNVYVRMAAQ
jgi:O-antigen ligase